MKNLDRFFSTDDLKNDEIYLKLNSIKTANIDNKLVPLYYFNIYRIKDNTAVGFCDLRVGYNEILYYAGNIGYKIYKEYRGNHYALKSVKLLFKLARKYEMDKIIITCNPDNISSIKTCEYLNGQLKEITKLPINSAMYKKGERRKCIYIIKI